MLSQMGGVGGMLMGGGYNMEERANNVCSSIFCALCVAPMIILASTCGLAWNEREAVCRDRTIQEARLKVEVVGCNETDRDGLLVMLNCPVVNKSLEAFHGEGPWQGYSQFGIGLEVIGEMKQCKEEVTEHDDGGSKGHHQKHKEYSHSVEWDAEPVNSHGFKTDKSSWKENCGAHNPDWPAEVPRSKRNYVKEMYVGSFKSTMTKAIPLDKPVDWPVPDKWKMDRDYYVSSQWETPSEHIGLVRVKFLTNDWTKPDVTLVGQSTGGRIQKWTASATSMCTGFTLHELKVGTWETEAFFDQLQEENMIRTWAFRAIGFAGLWLAFCCCLSPLSALGEAIPFFGECIGEAISALACVVACVPATAVFMLSAGFVWLLMRPMIGLPLILCSLVLFAIVCVGGMKISRAQGQTGKLSTEPLLRNGELPEPGFQQLQMATHAAPVQGQAVSPQQPQQHWQQPQKHMHFAGQEAVLQQPAYKQQCVQPPSASMAPPGVPSYAQAPPPVYAQAPCRQPQVAIPTAPAMAAGARPWEMPGGIVQGGAAAAAAAVTAAAAAVGAGGASDGGAGAPRGYSGAGNSAMGGQMMVQVPAGSGPGMSVQVHTPEGVPLQVVIPAGAMSGSNFLVQY